MSMNKHGRTPMGYALNTLAVAMTVVAIGVGADYALACTTNGNKLNTRCTVDTNEDGHPEFTANCPAGNAQCACKLDSTGVIIGCAGCGTCG